MDIKLVSSFERKVRDREKVWITNVYIISFLTINVWSNVKLVALISNYRQNTERSTRENCVFASWHPFCERAEKVRDELKMRLGKVKFGNCSEGFRSWATVEYKEVEEVRHHREIPHIYISHRVSQLVNYPF